MGISLYSFLFSAFLAYVVSHDPERSGVDPTQWDHPETRGDNSGPFKTTSLKPPHRGEDQHEGGGREVGVVRRLSKEIGATRESASDAISTLTSRTNSRKD